MQIKTYQTKFVHNFWTFKCWKLNSDPIKLPKKNLKILKHSLWNAIAWLNFFALLLFIKQQKKNEKTNYNEIDERKDKLNQKMSWFIGSGSVAVFNKRILNVGGFR